MKKIGYSLWLLLFFCQIKAQDIHFSQFNENPSLINPALTGIKDALRASMNYRSQWKSVTTPFTTYGASVEMKFKPSNWEQADQFRQKIYKRSVNRGSAGLSFYNDKAGDGKLSTTQVNLSLATFVKLNENHKLAVGLQAAVVQRKLDYSRLLFPTQYNGTTYDPSMMNGESYNNSTFIYSDVSAGLSWCYTKEESSFTSSEQKYADFGVSVYHLNRPYQNFVSGPKDRLETKVNVHGKLLLTTTEQKFAISPSFLLQFQGKNKEILIGSLFKYYLNIESKYTGYNRRSSIGLGVYYRNQDAMMTTLLLELKQYAIGFSYDINVSQLKTASSYNGAMEVVLRFNSPSAYLYQKK